MLIEYTPPIVDKNNVGMFKVDGETLEVDGNGVLKKCGMPQEPILDDNTQEQISDASSQGIASEIQAVGDCKKVTLNGAIGSYLTLSNYDTWVYILGFDHNSSLEGSGISFGGFKTAATGGTDICLIDSKYNSSYSDGEKCFNLNHWGLSSSPYNTNYGGWKGCDARYDILGSVDSAPSGYGSRPQTSRTGYNASSTTAINPVANTLMAAFPLDLRIVLKPITKYTDNKGNSSNTQANVTSSIDYLPLLSEYEVRGIRYNSNQYEQNSQLQYQYYSNGNSRVKYRHNSISSTAQYWLRSPAYSVSTDFCDIDTSGFTNNSSSKGSFGLTPVFLV